MNPSQIVESIKTSLSNSDLEKLVPGVPVTSYPELKEKRLSDIVDSYGRGFILFEEESTPNETSGHWFCICSQPGGMLVFDPYGGTESDPWYDGIKFNTIHKLRELGQGRPLLDDVFRNAGVKVLFNTTKFQKDIKDVNTCGRHCVVRLWNHQMTSPEYKEYIFSQGPEPDVTVTVLTRDVP